MIVVVGMHRSGTSAVTELLEHAGLPAPSTTKRYRSSQWNERGNHEIRPLTAFNERLLEAMGGRWDSPPPLPPGWPARGAAARLRRRARRVFAEQTPSPLVWKDPRLCLVLPFWEHTLDTRAPAVLVWRHPAAVTRSLQQRNGFSLALGVALWERYLRTALVALEAHSVLTVQYDAALADPLSFVDQARAALHGFGVELSAAAASTTITNAADPSMRHATAGPDDLVLSDEQHALQRSIAALPAVSASFTVPSLGPETATTAAHLQEHLRSGSSATAPTMLSRRIAQRLVRHR